MTTCLNQIASIFLFSLAVSLLTPGINAIDCTLTVIGEQSASNPATHDDLRLLANLSTDCHDADTIIVNLPHGNSKVFHQTVSETPSFGETVAYWSGEALEDGSEFDFIRGDDGEMYGTLVDTGTGNVVDISPDIDGNNKVTMMAATDFAEEEEEIDGDGNEEEVNPRRNLRGG